MTKIDKAVELLICSDNFTASISDLVSVAGKRIVRRLEAKGIARVNGEMVTLTFGAIRYYKMLSDIDREPIPVRRAIFLASLRK